MLHWSYMGIVDLTGIADGHSQYCYVPGVTRKELGNRILVIDKSAKSTSKI